MTKPKLASSPLEDELWWQLRVWKLDKGCVRQWRWAKGRRYAADFGWPDARLAVECEGGLYMARSGHNSLAGITRDIEKGNLAVESGIRMLRFTRDMIKGGTAIETISRLLEDHRR